MPEKPWKDTVSGTAAAPYREQSSIAPRPTVTGALGDSDSVKRYRQFFQTHDLHGLPRRGSEPNR
jgi:hypothetical protein